MLLAIWHSLSSERSLTITNSTAIQKTVAMFVGMFLGMFVYMLTYFFAVICYLTSFASFKVKLFTCIIYTNIFTYIHTACVITTQVMLNFFLHLVTHHWKRLTGGTCQASPLSHPLISHHPFICLYFYIIFFIEIKLLCFVFVVAAVNSSPIRASFVADSWVCFLMCRCCQRRRYSYATEGTELQWDATDKKINK